MSANSFRGRISLLALALLATTTLSASSFSGQFSTTTKVASTVPSNGDVNPYGVAVVPRSTGALVSGHILVSNFNNSNNLQGTGTTIVDISPNGTLKVFAQISASGLPGSSMSSRSISEHACVHAACTLPPCSRYCRATMRRERDCYRKA